MSDERVALAALIRIIQSGALSWKGWSNTEAYIDTGHEAIRFSAAQGRLLQRLAQEVNE